VKRCRNTLRIFGRCCCREFWGAKAVSGESAKRGVLEGGTESVLGAPLDLSCSHYHCKGRRQTKGSGGGCREGAPVNEVHDLLGLPVHVRGLRLVKHPQMTSSPPHAPGPADQKEPENYDGSEECLCPFLPAYSRCTVLLPLRGASL